MPWRPVAEEFAALATITDQALTKLPLPPEHASSPERDGWRLVSPPDGDPAELFDVAVGLARTHPGALVTEVARCLGRRRPPACDDPECRAATSRTTERPWRLNCFAEAPFEEAHRWGYVLAAAILLELEIQLTDDAVWGTTDDDGRITLDAGPPRRSDTKHRRRLAWFLCALREVLGTSENDHVRFGERLASLDPAASDGYRRGLDRDRVPLGLASGVIDAAHGGPAFGLLGVVIREMLRKMGINEEDQGGPTPPAGRIDPRSVGAYVAYRAVDAVEDLDEDEARRVSEEVLGDALREVGPAVDGRASFWAGLFERLEYLDRIARADQREAARVLAVARRLHAGAAVGPGFIARIAAWFTTPAGWFVPAAAVAVVALIVIWPDSGWRAKGRTAEAELSIGEAVCAPRAEPRCRWSLDEELHVFARRDTRSEYHHAAVVVLDAKRDWTVLAQGPLLDDGEDCRDGWCPLFGGLLQAPAGRLSLYVVFSARALSEDDALERARRAAEERVPDVDVFEIEVIAP
ncbi:MAG: hypothetical protein RIT81_20775 [Deltaproteobacteria bacterium]